MKLRRIGWWAVALSLSACTPNVVYNKYQPAPLTGWERNDTLFFDVPKLAQGGAYDMEMGVRINGEYPFIALTLIVEQTVLPKGTIMRDTVNCRFFDQQGRQLSGGISYFQYTFPIRTINLRTGDSLHITIRHGMKKELLPGISDVGINMRRF